MSGAGFVLIRLYLFQTLGILNFINKEDKTVITPIVNMAYCTPNTSAMIPETIAPIA